MENKKPTHKRSKKDRKEFSYKNSGVNIDAGNRFVKHIIPMAEKTKRSGVVTELGSFGALFDLKAAGYRDPILVAATDGVGTKIKLAVEAGILQFVGIDLVAMCVNDLICQGAEPLFFLDYFATDKLRPKDSRKILEGIVNGCKKANIALIGGETAEMPGMYKSGEFDLAGFAIGALNRGTEMPRDINSGDTLIGLLSSGLHSNGFSLVRKILRSKGMNVKGISPFSQLRLGNELLSPTKIYVKDLLPLIKSNKIKGLAHITGGGITENLPRILNNQFGAKIKLESWPLPKVFNWLFKTGNIEKIEALKTFNCGIGMIAIVETKSADEILRILNKNSKIAFNIGEVKKAASINYVGNFN